MARSIGREFSLIAATVRLINSGLLDRHPDLRIHMSHLGGGIATMLGRIRKYQDKAVLGRRRPSAARQAAGRRTSTTICTSAWCSTPPACAARSNRCRRRCWSCRRRAASSAPTIRRKSATPRASRNSSTEIRALGADGQKILAATPGCCSRRAKQPSSWASRPSRRSNRTTATGPPPVPSSALARRLLGMTAAEWPGESATAAAHERVATQRRRIHRLRAVGRAQAHGRGQLRLRARARRNLRLQGPARLRPRLFRAQGRDAPRSTA